MKFVQSFYLTRTDASNFERLDIYIDWGKIYIKFIAAGTGVEREIIILKESPFLPTRLQGKSNANND